MTLRSLGMVGLLARVDHDGSSASCVATCDMIGASALFLVTGSVNADSGRDLSLTTGRPCLEAARFRRPRRREHPYTTQVAAEWTLTDTAVERIKQSATAGA